VSLDLLEEIAKEEKYFDAIKKELDLVKAQLSHDKNADLDKNKAEIKEILGMELINRYYYQKGVAEFALRYDTEVQKAINVLSNPAEYKKILQITK
jgi:carboxyl-terminal processing protease